MAKRVLFIVGGAIAVGIIGLAFVLSAPLDDSARTSLGTGLITGLIVGIAVAAIEWMVERRREGHEQDVKEKQRATMYEVARSRLGRPRLHRPRQAETGPRRHRLELTRPLRPRPPPPEASDTVRKVP